MKARGPEGLVEPLNSNPYLALAGNQMDDAEQAAVVRSHRGRERCKAIGKGKDLRRGC